MKTLMLTLFSLCLILGLRAQELARIDFDTEVMKTMTSDVSDSKNEKEVKAKSDVLYVSEEDKVFVNKSEKVFLWISNSEDPGSKKQLLKTHSNAMDYFYFDTEGINTIRSPWAVDPETGKVLSPKQDVVFDVYADGVAPATQSVFSGAKKYFKNGKVYYGKGLQVDLKSYDRVSGVANTYVAMDGKDFSEFNGSFDISKENENSISYYAVDHVGNTEDPVTKNFIVDLTSPETSYEVIGKNEGSVLAANAKIALASMDKLSQVKTVKYRIGNEGDFRTYTGAISLAAQPDGDVEINYYAEDNVQNAEEIKSTNKESGKNKSGDVISAGLYLDKIAPEVTIKTNGDQYDGKYFYVSERSKFELTATDNKAGVSEIFYNNGGSVHHLEEPFSAASNAGLQYIHYQAVDKVGNKSKDAVKTIYLDKRAPKSNISFHGVQVIERDSLFITSDTKVKITTSELESGVQKVEYRVNNGAASLYSDLFKLENEGTHHIAYNATDNVNNAEEMKNYSVIVDNTPPVIDHTFSFPPLASRPVDGHDYKVLPNYAKVYLAATDKTTGVKSITYSINGGPVKAKTTIEYFKKGTFDIDVTATDPLGNASTETIRIIVE